MLTVQTPLACISGSSFYTKWVIFKDVILDFDSHSDIGRPAATSPTSSTPPDFVT